MSGAKTRKDLIRALLKGIETGDPASVVVVNEAKYVQHNPMTREGSEGLAALFARLAKTSPRVNVARAFSDGDYVFAHTEYDLSTRRIGFEVFRFEEDQAVEHWDNIMRRPEHLNPTGRGMVDGPTEATDLDRTEANREFVRKFVDDVLVHRRLDELGRYVDGQIVQHNPSIGDGLDALRSALEVATPDAAAIVYDRTHRLLAEGNFVLSVSEGTLGGVHTSFYDLFRISAEGKIAEHWDTVEEIPPRSEWKNDNGKF
ncbi:hypothetical protein CTAYLR_004713 [Chrysophaeum taylorii]|uniref:SnoaL-like domain-containing protein n=1 Tax=Chrysophaeum taylorii TaxID=2483200 RepID=A0AAD7U7B0_9STRA|nr:hypothetical protein CTAYLR_004713 [Chrysophaeum taylorii]